MVTNVYEGMYILDSNKYGRDPEGVSGRIPAMIQKAGGEIMVSRLWEERRLAYAVKGHRKGTYWLTYFRLDASKLADIRRQCQLNEDVLRVLFLKVDPRIVDAMVAHAQAGPSYTSASEEGGEDAKPKKRFAHEVAEDVDSEDTDADEPSDDEED